VTSFARKISRQVVAGVLLAGVALGAASASPASASGALTFRGKVANYEWGTNILVVAADSTAVRGVPSTNGSFSVSVPGSLAKKFREYPGASVQVLKFGYYVGPVRLDGGNSWRLTERLPASVDLGSITVSESGGRAKVASSLLRRGSTRLQTRFEPAPSGEMAWTESGGDADADGIPNLYDADADGNGVADGEQLSQEYKLSAKDMRRINAKNSLTVNFGSDTWLQARFSDDQKSGTPVNTNILPNGTLEELQAYQATALRLDTGHEITKGRSAFLDCVGHVYCPSDGVLPMLPADWDTKKEWGRIDVPIGLVGTGQLTPEGHTDIVIVKKGKSVISQKVATITGIATVPPVLASVGGVPVSYPLNPSKNTFGKDSLSALTVELYRPQQLRTKPDLFMADRGGFIYTFRGTVGGKSGPCNAANIMASDDLIAVTPGWKDPYTGQRFWDAASKPANGGKLKFTIDLYGCANNSKDDKNQYVGVGLMIEVRDARNTNMQINYTAAGS